MLYKLPRHLYENLFNKLDFQASYLFILTDPNFVYLLQTNFFYLFKKYGPKIIFKLDSVESFKSFKSYYKFNQNYIEKSIFKYGSISILKWLYKNKQIKPDKIFSHISLINISNYQNEILIIKNEFIDIVQYIYLDCDERLRWLTNSISSNNVEKIKTLEETLKEFIVMLIGNNDLIKKKRDPLVSCNNFPKYNEFWIYIINEYVKEYCLGRRSLIWKYISGSNWIQISKFLLDFFMKKKLINALIKLDEIMSNKNFIDKWDSVKVSNKISVNLNITWNSIKLDYIENIYNNKNYLCIILPEILHLEPYQRDKLIEIYFNHSRIWEEMLNISSIDNLYKFTSEGIIYLTSKNLINDSLKYNLYQIGIITSLTTYQEDNFRLIHKYIFDNNLIDINKINSLVKKILKKILKNDVFGTKYIKSINKIIKLNYK